MAPKDTGRSTQMVIRVTHEVAAQIEMLAEKLVRSRNEIVRMTITLGLPILSKRVQKLDLTKPVHRDKPYYPFIVTNKKAKNKRKE